MFAVGSWNGNAVGSQELNLTNNIIISGETMYVYVGIVHTGVCGMRIPPCLSF